jgi:hypothetical protein
MAQKKRMSAQRMKRKSKPNRPDKPRQDEAKRGNNEG